MPDPDTLPVGKLPLDLLTQLLAPLTPRDPRVRVGARAGEDAAIIDLGARLLVVAADPITFATDQIGRYAVAVNANDVAVRGATPHWFLATLLLPAGTTRAGVQAIMDDLAAACGELEIDLVGGHTEVTSGINRPIVAGTMLGEVAPAHLVTTGGAQPGDALLLGGALAIEGTAVLAREAADALQARGVPSATIACGADLLRAPGISVVAMARVLCDTVQPHAMHDPTEGGLATALAEIAAASGVGVHLEAHARLPFLPETRAFCRALGLDPLGLLASGALLAAVDPNDASAALDALRSCGAGSRVIGRITAAAEGLTMATAEGPVPLPAFARDELARWLEG
jgi:hydrogenase maturation factor